MYEIKILLQVWNKNSLAFNNYYSEIEYKAVELVTPLKVFMLK